MVTLTLVQAFVLHFAHCSLKDWRAKYKNLGDFSNTAWLGAEIPAFYKRSRDVIKTSEPRCKHHPTDEARAYCVDSLHKEFYQKEVSD